MLKGLLEASDRERQLVAYEIHDGLVQYLTGATMQLEALAAAREGLPRWAQDAYGTAKRLLHNGLEEARRLIGGLRPPVLDQSGVVPAIEHLIGEAAVEDQREIEFQCDVQFERLEPLLENALFRIVQESLSNARRHSGSKKLRVQLQQNEDRILATVQDWGVGFDPDQISEKQFGLAGIRERAKLMGGQAIVESTPGQGTRVVVDLPLVEPRSAAPARSANK